ncbi:MAG: hypothetical protein ACI9MC_001565 [Kiritimatiellia bacterium]|jgi:hypothetical protein
MEFLIEDVRGPGQFGVPDQIINLYTVPHDQTLVITETQARAAGCGA